jgi:hypothetical protein
MMSGGPPLVGDDKNEKQVGRICGCGHPWCGMNERIDSDRGSILVWDRSDNSLLDRAGVCSLAESDQVFHDPATLNIKSTVFRGRKFSSLAFVLPGTTAACHLAKQHIEAKAYEIQDRVQVKRDVLSRHAQGSHPKNRWVDAYVEGINDDTYTIHVDYVSKHSRHTDTATITKSNMRFSGDLPERLKAVGQPLAWTSEWLGEQVQAKLITEDQKVRIDHACFPA